MRVAYLLPLTGLIAGLSAPAVTSAQPTAPAPALPTAADALAATQGRWTGELQYRDYQSDTWQGLPMTVTIMAQPDGVATVRTAQFDDGPQTGIVTITSVTMVDAAAATASYAFFRKGRATDVGSAAIVRFQPGTDANHWTLITTETRPDGDSVAQVRETTIRAGSSMTTLKEVNPVGDGVDNWLPRNRTVLVVATGGN